MVEYASVLWNRYVVSADGKTAYERLRGKKPRMLGLEFGEKLHWKRSVATIHRTDKLDSVWEEGIYLGHTTLSGESIVGNADGVFRTRTVRRAPLEERWQFELIKSMVGLPWKCNPHSDEAEQVIQDDMPVAPSDKPAIPPEPPQVAFREEVPRKVYVKTDTMKQIGYTGAPQVPQQEEEEPQQQQHVPTDDFGFGEAERQSKIRNDV